MVNLDEQIHNMKAKKTIVLGASTNTSRYSNMAVKKLLNHGYEVIPVGIKKGEIEGVKIATAEEQESKDVDTVTMYLGPQNQKPYYNYIIDLKPKRVIFNPGTINPEFMKRLEEEKIEAVDACTLVMLSADTY